MYISVFNTSLSLSLLFSFLYTIYIHFYPLIPVPETSSIIMDRGSTELKLPRLLLNFSTSRACSSRFVLGLV